MMWKVWIFLAPLCPICQDYTHYLNALHEFWSMEHAGEVELVGWFPNPRVTDEQVADFRVQYDVKWELSKDTVGWSHWLEAKWTPEAFLISPEGEVVYRGRVNDLYYALGKHRSVPVNSDLALAVSQALQGAVIDPKETNTIGCPIELRYPLNDSLARQILFIH